MAVTRGPIEAGSVVRLRPATGSGESITAYAPGGSTHTFPTPRSLIDLWLPEVGTWRYAWSDGTEGVLEVVPSTRAEVEVDRSILTRTPPPMLATTRPRI